MVKVIIIVSKLPFSQTPSLNNYWCVDSIFFTGRDGGGGREGGTDEISGERQRALSFSTQSCITTEKPPTVNSDYMPFISNELNSDCKFRGLFSDFFLSLLVVLYIVKCK